MSSKRKASASRFSANQSLYDQIALIKQEHPLWGYRRIWAYLRYRKGMVVGKNRVYHVMGKHSLLVQKNDRLRAKRYVGRPKPRATCLNEYWGMDMTKILFPCGWWYLHVVKDWYSKEIVGWSFAPTSRTEDWLDALNNGVNRCFSQGIRSYAAKPALVTDNGCQPTSTKFMKACSELDIKQIFTSWNNPKGNADTERVMRTIKEDLVWIYDWDDPIKFKSAFATWVEKYNTDFPHMSLGWMTPSQFAQNTLLVAA